MNKTALAVSVLSGCIWGVVGLSLGRHAFGRLIWGGVFATPFLGVAVGALAVRLAGFNLAARIVLSLLTLYAAAWVFGLAIGVLDLATGVNSWTVPGGYGRRIPSGVILQAGNATLWGITFTGYALVLWPLSFLNHWVLWRLAPAGSLNGSDAV